MAKSLMASTDNFSFCNKYSVFKIIIDSPEEQIKCVRICMMRKPDFCICENKDADQLRGNREADQGLCFRYIDSTIPLLPKSEMSSL